MKNLGMYHSRHSVYLKRHLRMKTSSGLFGKVQSIGNPSQTILDHWNHLRTTTTTTTSTMEAIIIIIIIKQGKKLLLWNLHDGSAMYAQTVPICAPSSLKQTWCEHKRSSVRCDREVIFPNDSIHSYRTARAVYDVNTFHRMMMTISLMMMVTNKNTFFFLFFAFDFFFFFVCNKRPRNLCVFTRLWKGGRSIFYSL